MKSTLEQMDRPAVRLAPLSETPEASGERPAGMITLDELFATLNRFPEAQRTNDTSRHVGAQVVSLWASGKKRVTVQFATHREQFTEQEFRRRLEHYLGDLTTQTKIP
ncbi:MAG: hypothetical protein VW338_08665 [Rhodospirillaceae bacterium]